MNHATQLKLADLRAKTDRDLTILTGRLIERGMAAIRPRGAQAPAEALWHEARSALALIDGSGDERPRLERKLDLLRAKLEAARVLSACA